MIRNLKDNLKFLSKISRLKRQFAPDQVFLKTAREIFLSSLTPARVRIPHHFIRWGYAAAVVVVVLGSTGGLAAFADIKDVPVTSSLYELKRVSETARLALTPEEKKPEAHVKLAQRRLKEIKQAQPPVAVTTKSAKTISVMSAPASASADAVTPLPIVKKLDKDLRREIGKVIEQKTEDRKEERKTRVCKLAAEALENNLIEPRRGGTIEKSCRLDF